MTQKRTHKRYPGPFKEETVDMVREREYTVPEAAICGNHDLEADRCLIRCR